MDIQRLLFNSFYPGVCCILFGSIFIFIYSIFFTIAALGSLQEESTLVIQSLSENLSLPPISDLLITDSKCPADYQLKKLGEWPGIREGCKVGDTIQEKCDEVSFEVGGSKFSVDMGDYIAAKNPISYYTWADRRFCVKYNTNYKQSNMCMGNYRKCSPGLCILKNESCPIT
jgi:hypothetical protein